MTYPYGSQQQGGWGHQPGGFASQPPGGYGPQPAGYPPPAPWSAAPPDYAASWGQRVGAYLLDGLPVVLVCGVALSGSHFVVGIIPPWAVLLCLLCGLGWNIYNRWIKAGRTGQSLGKRALRIVLVGAQTRQPIGPGRAFGRDIAHALDAAACYLGFLWPLWDEKSQTFADKIASTVVIQAAGQGQQPPPGYGPGYGQPPSAYRHPQQSGYGHPPQGAFYPPGHDPSRGGYPQRPYPPHQPGPPRHW